MVSHDSQDSNVSGDSDKLRAESRVPSKESSITGTCAQDDRLRDGRHGRRLATPNGCMNDLCGPALEGSLGAPVAFLPAAFTVAMRMRRLGSADALVQE